MANLDVHFSPAYTAPIYQRACERFLATFPPEAFRSNQFPLASCQPLVQYLIKCQLLYRKVFSTLSLSLSALSRDLSVASDRCQWVPSLTLGVLIFAPRPDPFFLSLFPIETKKMKRGAKLSSQKPHTEVEGEIFGVEIRNLSLSLLIVFISICIQ